MAIRYQELLARKFAPIEYSYTRKDTMLYALGICCGDDPVDERDLPFVYEEGLKAIPAMATVLATPGFWLKNPDTGVTWQKVLHGEQRLAMHAELPPEGRVRSEVFVDQVIDKGEGRGALIYVRREIYDTASGCHLCTASHSSFARADGGFGGPAGPIWPVHALPERKADLVCDLRTWPHSGLLYRLNGDFNPIHGDPAAAREAGFDRPILHGLCTFGVAARAIIRTICDNDPARLAELNVRFSAPVMPGDTIRTEVWRHGDGTASFRCSVPDRELMVLNNGFARQR